MKQKECDQFNHEPNIKEITFGYVEAMGDGGFILVMDVPCKKCGASGSFGVQINYKDINW